MKKIFLDCGTHLGWGFEHFRKKYSFDETWEIHLFEPNPNLKNYIIENVVNKHPNLNIAFHELAIGSLNTPRRQTISLQTLGEDPKGIHPAGATGGGSSIVSTEYFKEGELENYETVEVSTAPLSSIIYQLATKAYNEDNSICAVVNTEHGRQVSTLYRDKCKIVVKLDVEGTEYEILPEIIKNGIGSWLTDIWIEFHSRRFSNESELREIEVQSVGKLFQMGVVCYPHW